MVRQSNGMGGRFGRGGARGGFRGRGYGRGGHGDYFFGGRGGIQKPPPLLARPMMPLPNIMITETFRDSFRGPVRPPPPMPLLPSIPGMNDFDDFGRMGPSRMSRPPLIRSPRGAPNLRMGPRSHGGPRPPLRGILPNPRPPSGLLPPPMPMPRPPGPMFRPQPLIPSRMMGPINLRERGMPGIMRGGPLITPHGVPRGMPRGRGIGIGRGGPNIRRGGRPPRGRGIKNSSSPSRELNKPWVTEAMKNEILKKHKLHQRAKKARTKEDWHELWEAFKEHRNKVTTMLREAKLEYIGAHPDEDVDKILAEATTLLSNKDEPNTDSTGNVTTNKTEGVEPMEEGGEANEVEPPQDPEVENKQESSCDAEHPDLDSETELKPDSESDSRLESESKSAA